MINLSELPIWESPWRSTGSDALLRISSSALKTLPGSCQMEKVAKAHVGKYQEARDWATRKDPRAVFLLGAVRAVLAMTRTPTDLVQIITTELGENATEPSLAAAKMMVRNALNAVDDFAADDLAEGLLMTPTTDFVCISSDQNRRLELTSWGVYYQSSDKSVRELRMFCYRDADLARDRNQLITAVNILLNGASTDGPLARWTEPYQTLPTNPPQRVRIRQIGCLDSSAATLFDGDAASAAAFVGGMPAIVQDFLTNPEFTPGNNCVECKFRISCPEITKVPGFLGLPTAGKISKSLSRAMLSSYQRCNYQYFLTYVLKLPKKTFESNAAIVRGNAVHEWIMAAHERQIACSSSDLPAAGLGAIATKLGWTQEYLAQARNWINSHIQVCPFQHAATHLLSEQTRTVWDCDADVVITTRADELGTRAGKSLWREIKTTSTMSEMTKNEYLLLYPQVAFAIGIQAAAGGGLVELEILTPETGQIVAFDAADPAIQLAATTALAINFDQLHHDEEFSASPGMACISCPVSAWCDQRASAPATKEVLVDGLEVDLVTGEIISSAPVAVDALAKALALVEPVDQTDDLPF
ncbi:MAG: hypothetical protein F2563_02670 [Actinobacteria bacterium]|jgi:hypothetical protein|uniref:Unannotated protein n=1 Tax=freshwater metagenome TaxID=449393 RepID=A0A6J6EGM1_9ZZZZ|nr:hypothetical protein [Actinomycetota bacterium]